MAAPSGATVKILVLPLNMDAVFTFIRMPTNAYILASCVALRSGMHAKRTAIERSIGSFKYVLGVEQRKTFNAATTKADIFLAGIVQLLSVILANAIHEQRLFRRIRRLTA